MNAMRMTASVPSVRVKAAFLFILLWPAWLLRADDPPANGQPANAERNVIIGSGWELFTLRHNGPVSCVVFSPDGRQIASASGTPVPHANGTPPLVLASDGTRPGQLKLWNAATGREEHTWNFVGIAAA
jgi:WD40 repeat protein